MTARWRLMIFPILLALSGILLLLRVSTGESLLFPEDLDTILITLILLPLLFIALLLIIRDRMRYWVSQSREEARAETLAEHRRFMRRLDHELKNPVMSLRAGLSTLMLTASDDSERELINTLSNTVQRLNLLVTNLRKLAEIETLAMDRTLIDVSQLVQEAVELVKDSAEQAGLTLRVEHRLSASMPTTLWGDYDLLLLVLHNILDNAIKYSESGKGIVVKLSTLSNDLVIEVEDNGIGIPLHEAKLVWEELYRGSNVQAVPGTGIGLSIAQSIVEAHGGEATLKSRENVGTTVTIRLPLTSPRTPEPPYPR